MLKKIQALFSYHLQAATLALIHLVINRFPPR